MRPIKTWRQLWSPFSRPIVLCVLLGFGSTVVAGQSLRGSAASLDVQTSQAKRHNFTYLRGTTQVRQFVDAGLLVPVDGNHDYTLKDVSFPFGRPEVKLFIERISGQYRRACGERLVITSLTRPKSKQPRNASNRSVHPTGMAIDLRRPQGTCRRWLEGTLLYLEDQGVLEGTAERRPPHYHVAVFPNQYAAYVERSSETGAESAPQPRVYTVRRGDSLWKIARRHGASISALRRANGLTSTQIYPGQSLDVSVVERSSETGAESAPQPHVYTVRRGDSLWKIARRHGASISALRRANGLTSTRIYPGQSLDVSVGLQ